MKIYSFFIPLLVAGCSTINDDSFRRVSSTVEQTSGNPIHHLKTEQDFARVHPLVQSMLSSNLTADGAVQIALLNNRQLHGTLEELGVSQADLIQAGLPQNIQLGGSWRFPNEPSPYDAVEYSASTSVLDLFMLPLRKKVARRNLEMAELRVSREVLGLIFDVKNALLSLQAEQQLTQRLLVMRELNELAVELAVQQHKAGNITDLQLANQRAVLGRIKIALAQSNIQTRSSRERLNRLLGLWGTNTEWSIQEALPPLPATDPDLENLESKAMTNRLDVIAAQKAVENAVYAHNLRSRTRFLPTVIHAGVSGEREPHGERLIGPELELELPLFDTGRTEVAKLAARKRQAERQFESVAINARSEVREARDMLIAARDLTRFYAEVLLPQYKIMAEQTLLHYNAMQVGTFDLISAKERELEAERNHLEAWKTYWIARNELERALSGASRGMAGPPNINPSGSGALQTSSADQH
jgi:cobalt-zinc-cadmium efflux system outer membrane protein